MLLPLMVALPASLLLGAGLVSSRWANRHPLAMRRAAVALLLVSCLMSAIAPVLLVAHGPVDVPFLACTRPIPLNVGVYYDSLTAIMLLLITFIGLLIARFSARYLDGEATQGRFFRWMLFTLGAVCWLVLSRNLVIFTIAWMLTSFGLHQLLTHYPERTWALWAARKKFLISRLGDAVLIAALVLTFYSFGSFDYATLFAAVQSPQTTAPRGLIPLIGVLFVVGAMTKSAQVPFHSWLPDTMETPTPVSALMHAGVINAGGFLVIRLSPLVTQSQLALDFLALIGALTALLGGVVMLTQTSVKRSLAYSTIAQMGFMMLQCGLGAFSAALLHIVAHSLYKAHAFLSSGSVLESASRVRTPAKPVVRGAYAAVLLPVALVLAVTLVGVTAWLFGVDYSAKPGAGILGLILSVALTHLLWHALTFGSWRLTVLGIAAAAAVSGSYFAAYLLMDRLLATSVSHQPVTPSPLYLTMIAIAAGGFLGVFALQAATRWLPALPLVRAIYVHAANGFYLDIPARRLTAWVWRAAGPTP
jgi:NAD(P)H-quinone oxidoreductase subunit 5